MSKSVGDSAYPNATSPYYPYSGLPSFCPKQVEEEEEEEDEKACIRPKVASTNYFRDSYTKEGKSAEEKVRKQTRLAAGASNDSIKFECDFVSPASRQLCLDRSVNIEFDRSESWKDGMAGLAIKQGRSEEDYGYYNRLSVETIEQSLFADFYTIFDGHRDRQQCSYHVALHLPLAIQKYLFVVTDLNVDTITQAITLAMKEVEEATVRMDGGTTATCALRIGDKIYVINVGDSRTILVKEKEVYQLTEDADPESGRFNRAVHNMGHEVITYIGLPRISRINGGLAMARDIGYNEVSAQPKITRISFNAEHRPEEGLLSYQEGDFLVLATDGLWDVMSNNEVARAIREFSRDESSAEVIAQLLVQEALNRWKSSTPCSSSDTTDDIGVMVMKLGLKKMRKFL